MSVSMWKRRWEGVGKTYRGVGWYGSHFRTHGPSLQDVLAVSRRGNRILLRGAPLTSMTEGPPVVIRAGGL